MCRDKHGPNRAGTAKAVSGLAESSKENLVCVYVYAYVYVYIYKINVYIYVHVCIIC